MCICSMSRADEYFDTIVKFMDHLIYTCNIRHLMRTIGEHFEMT